MRNIKPLIVIIIAFIHLSTSCKKEICEGDVPEINFESFDNRYKKKTTGKDSLAILNISFKDCNGDIGLDDTEDGSNLYIGYRVKKNGKFQVDLIDKYVDTTINGVFIEDYYVGSDTIKYDVKIPPLTPTGNNKAIKGDIEVEISVERAGDTVKYIFYLVDQDSNRSNIDSTSVIILNH